MSTIPQANFTPVLQGYTGQGSFRYWCQTALPLVYDDSLSYYELLNKVVVYLNNAVSDVSNAETNINSLLEAFIELQEYVNDYFYSGEQIEPIIDRWLEEHPEATTTVLDGSISVNKLTKKLQLKSLIQLDDLTFNEEIALPVTTSYAEAITFFNNKYYVACKDFTATPNTHYIAIYDHNLEYISSVYTDPTYGTIHNITNDGTNLYGDFSLGYHVKFDENVENDIAVFNPDYFCTAFYDDSLYGIEVYQSAIKVSKLESDLTTVIEEFYIPTTRQELQSANIIDGIVIVCTTYGLFKFVDLQTQTMIAEIPYYGDKEIENVFSVNNEIKVCGHFYGYNGSFCVGEFNAGVDYPVIQYPPLDASVGRKNILASGMAKNIYKVTNGTAIGLPFDSGDLFVFGNTRLFINTTNNKLYLYTGSNWLEFGGGRINEVVNINIGTNQSIVCKKVGATISMQASITVTAGSVTAGETICTLPTGFRPGRNLIMPICGRTSQVWANATYYNFVLVVNNNGTVSISGNQEALNSCTYFYVCSSYVNV